MFEKIFGKTIEEGQISYITLSKALKFIATVDQVTVDATVETAKEYIEFERQLNEVIPVPVHCPCELLPFEEMVDTDFVIYARKHSRGDYKKS